MTMPFVSKRASGYVMFVDGKQIAVSELFTAREVKSIRRTMRRTMPRATIRVMSVHRVRY